MADGYLFVMLKWAGRTGLDVSSFANLAAFDKRVTARPAVQQALIKEDLIKAA